MQRPNSCPWSWKSPPHLGYAVVCGLIWKTLKKHLGLFLPSCPQQRQSYLSVKVSLMLWLMAVRQNKNSTASLLVWRSPEKKRWNTSAEGPRQKKAAEPQKSHFRLATEISWEATGLTSSECTTSRITSGREHPLLQFYSSNLRYFGNMWETRWPSLRQK